MCTDIFQDPFSPPTLTERVNLGTLDLLKKGSRDMKYHMNTEEVIYHRVAVMLLGPTTHGYSPKYLKQSNNI